MSISITTNGTIITPDILHKLFQNNIKSLTISLDNIENNNIRIGCDLEQLKDNIICLIDYIQKNSIKTKVSLRTSVNKNNMNELDQIFQFCLDNGINRLKINNTNPIGRARNIQSILLEEADFRELTTKFYNRNKCCSDKCKIEIPIEKYITENSKLTTCQSGISTFNIFEDGSVFPCGFTEVKLILRNLNKNKLSSIFKNYSFSFDNEVCQVCKMNTYKDKTAITMVQDQFDN